MNIFVDRHHDALLYSLHLLFEERLGWNLFYPVGMEWFSKGYWKIGDPYPNPEDTAIQYLRPGSVPKDGTPILSEYYPDGCKHKTLTLNQFENKEIHVVIASYLGHVAPYAELVKQFQPSARLVHQMGNNWAGLVDYTVVKNILASTSSFEVPNHVNITFYHQEFDLSVFKYSLPSGKKKVSSFVNCWDSFPDRELFYELEKAMPDWDFKMYGASNRDGNLTTGQIASEMADSSFVWHVKAGGDGYGHTIHNAYAMGRPAIVKRDYYKGMLADDLFEDMVTSVDIDGLPVEGVKFKLEEAYSKAHAMSFSAYAKFREKVNFKREFAEKILPFINQLV